MDGKNELKDLSQEYTLDGVHPLNWPDVEKGEEHFLMRFNGTREEPWASDRRPPLTYDLTPGLWDSYAERELLGEVELLRFTVTSASGASVEFEILTEQHPISPPLIFIIRRTIALFESRYGPFREIMNEAVSKWRWEGISGEADNS